MLLFHVFRCLCLVVSFCVQCDGSLEPGFSKIQRGYRLNRKLIQSLAQFSFLDCVVECLVTPRCKSVNYFKGANFCETNYENKTTANTKYEDNAGWVYSEKEHWPKDLAGACANSNCQINQTCKDKKYSMDPTNECVLSDDLSCNKSATQSHTYTGWNRYDVSYAVDRNPSSCMRTMDIGQNAIQRTVWWKVDLGREYSIYSISILFKNYNGYENRQRGRFAGFSLYVSTTDVSAPNDIKSSTLCYKDGPQLPPLNFTATCTEHGRYVIFYNERLDGITYPQEYELLALTELCEVIIKGCETSVYGSSCNISCPTNCKENICHIQHGTCSACKPGWFEMHCNTKCREGWYGDNCSQQFTGHCIDGTTCNHVTGLCDGGCDTGWTGSVCDKECDDGTYGYNCVNNCSGHCLNGSICNKQHGHCDRGCDPGYTDNDCGKECVKSYGENCQYPCSQHCINQTCDIFTGKCLSWCQEGFYGQKCNHESQKTEYVTSWIIAFSIVLFIVVLLITGGFVCFWVLYKRLFYGNKRLFWTSWFRENEITTTDNTTNYIEPNNYQDLNPVTNSSYQDLNPNTNSNYQTLNINTNYRELKLQYGEEEIQYQNTTE